MNPPIPPDHTAVVALEGALTVNYAEEQRIRLLAALEAAPTLVVDLVAVTAADVFGLQLLVAGQRSARSRGKILEVIHASDAVRAACEATGIEPAALGVRSSSPSP